MTRFRNTHETPTRTHPEKEEAGVHPFYTNWINTVSIRDWRWWDRRSSLYVSLSDRTTVQYLLIDSCPGRAWTILPITIWDRLDCVMMMCMSTTFLSWFCIYIENKIIEWSSIEWIYERMRKIYVNFFIDWFYNFFFFSFLDSLLWDEMNNTLIRHTVVGSVSRARRVCFPCIVWFGSVTRWSESMVSRYSSFDVIMSWFSFLCIIVFCVCVFVCVSTTCLVLIHI